MLRFINPIYNFLLCICLGILLTGGFEIATSNIYIEFNQPDVFAIILVILGFKLFNSKYSASENTKKILNWGLDSKKKSLYFFVGVFLLLFIARCLRHWTLNTSMVDVGAVHQPIFHVFSPKLMYSNANWNDSQLAGHMTWIFIPVGILLGWAKSDLVLFIFKFFVVATALWIFVTRGPLKKIPKVWFWFLFVVFASKALRNAMVWDFREDDIAFAAFLLAILCLWKGQLALYGLSLLIALSCKENIPPIAIGLIIPILFDKDLPLSKRQRYWTAALTAVVSVIYMIVIFKYLIPYFMGDTEVKNNLILRFPGMGSTTKEVVINVLTRPDLVFKFLGPNLFSSSSLMYLIFLLLPFFWWSLRKPIWLIPAIPGILMNVLSSAHTQRMMIFHYEQVILCFLIPAAAFGLAKMMKDTSTSKQLWYVFALPIGLSLCVFGRPPQVEMRQRLVKDGHRVPDVIKLGRLNFSEPVASDHHMIAHLSHLDAIRLINYPEDAVPTNMQKAAKKFLHHNPIRTMADEGRDAADAKWIVVNRENPWGSWLETVLSSKNSLESQNNLFSVYKLKKPIYETLCTDWSACR